MPSLGAPRIRLLNKACIPLWECYASTTKYSNVIKIEIVTQSLQLHTKKMVSTDPDHKQHKHKTKPPLHHEYRRRNHSWPNEEGEVRMDSKLQYNRQLKQWAFIWVYGKDAASPCENQAEVSICAVDPGVRTFLTW